MATTSPKRPTEKVTGEVRKADLIEAAISIFSDKGYDGSSLQDIAARIGILKGSVYYYYKSKEDILFDILTLVHNEHLENVRSLSKVSGPPMLRLRELLAGHAAFVCQHLERTTVFVREMDRLPPGRRDEILGSDHAYQRVFRDMITEAQKAGDIAPELNPKLATLWILGSLNWLHRWYRPGHASRPEQVGEQFADQLTRGLAASSLWQQL